MKLLFLLLSTVGDEAFSLNKHWQKRRVASILLFIFFITLHCFLFMECYSVLITEMEWPDSSMVWCLWHTRYRLDSWLFWGGGVTNIPIFSSSFWLFSLDIVGFCFSAQTKRQQLYLLQKVSVWESPENPVVAKLCIICCSRIKLP